MTASIVPVPVPVPVLAPAPAAREPYPRIVLVPDGSTPAATVPIRSRRGDRVKAAMEMLRISVGHLDPAP